MNEKLNLRLPEHYVKIIRKIFLDYFRADDKLWLFGSRVNLEKRGGDIDLYIETNIDNYDDAIDKKIAFLSSLKREIGDQKIDVVLQLLSSDNKLLIYEIAKSEGVRIV